MQGRRLTPTAFFIWTENDGIAQLLFCGYRKKYSCPMSFKAVPKAALGYFVFALAFTFPLVLHMTDSVFGPPEDNFQFVWNFWWIGKVLAHPSQALFQTDFLFHPNGVSLYFHTLSLANTFLAIPLQKVISPWQAYNILVLLIFIARGLGMFLLARYFVKSNAAAFIAGFIFTFSPFFFAKSLHHLNISSSHFVPLIILFLFRLRDKPSVRNAAGLGLVLWLNALNCWVYLAFSVLVVGGILIGFGFSNPGKLWNRRFWGAFCGGIALFLAAIARFLWPLVGEILNGRTYMAIRERSSHFLDPALLLVPSDIHPANRLTRNLILRIYNHLPGDNWELNYFIGYTGILLVALGFRRAWKQRHFFWPAWSAAFMLLAMGHSLHIAGFDLGLPLPYRVLADLPFFQLLRVPGRFFGLALCGLCVLAAAGFQGVATWLQKRPALANETRAALGICLLLGIEYLPFPVERTPVAPSALEQRIAADQSCRAVLDIPLQGYASHCKQAPALTYKELPFRQTHYFNFASVHMFRQILHGKRILSGHVARIPPEATAYMAASPLRILDQLDTTALLDPGAKPRLIAELRRLGIGYILLHKDFLLAMDPGLDRSAAFTEGFLASNFERIPSDRPGVSAFWVPVE